MDYLDFTFNLWWQRNCQLAENVTNEHTRTTNDKKFATSNAQHLSKF